MQGHSQASEAWAIGCMLFCMLTGRPPFETGTVISVIVIPHLPYLLELLIFRRPSKDIQADHKGRVQMAND